MQHAQVGASSICALSIAQTGAPLRIKV